MALLTEKVEKLEKDLADLTQVRDRVETLELAVTDLAKKLTAILETLNHGGE